MACITYLFSLFDFFMCMYMSIYAMHLCHHSYFCYIELKAIKIFIEFFFKEKKCGLHMKSFSHDVN